MPGERDGFDASVSVDAGRPVVVVRGEVDVVTADRLRIALREALAVGGPVEVDLRNATFMDARGVRALMEAYEEGGHEPGRIVLRDPQPAVRRVLGIVGVTSFMPLRESSG